MSLKKDGMTSLRLPKELIAQMDAEVAILADEPEYRAMRITRGVVIHMAINEWLQRRKSTRKSAD